jgi:ubiquinone biosynthesis accessory factor UbiJ
MWSALLLVPLNHLFRQQPWATRRLAPFSGAQGRFCLDGDGDGDGIAPPHFTFRIAEDGSLIQAEGDAYDVEVEMPRRALASLADGPQAVFAQAQIRGRAELAEALREVFQHLRPDIEDDLAKLVGDVAARRIVGWMTDQAAQLRRGAEALATGLRENLQHEAQMLPGRADYERFRGETLSLQQAADGLQTRLQRLERPR